MKEIICNVALAYEAAIFIRIILSWFPLKPEGVMRRINDVLITITEPVLGPIRRALPRTGFIDLSPLIAALAIEIVLRQLSLRC